MNIVNVFFRSFKANKKLRKIHPNAFAGILNVIEL